MENLKMILASTEDCCINMLWNIKEDMTHFKNMTTGSSEKSLESHSKRSYLIMGRKTYESLPQKLHDREYIIMSRNNNYGFSFEQVISMLDIGNPNKIYWVIGGKDIFRLFENIVSEIYYTRINVKSNMYNTEMKTLVYYDFPSMYFDLVSYEKKMCYDKVLNKELECMFCVYKNNFKMPPISNSQECHYLSILQKTLNSQKRLTRNGNTYSYFGDQIRFDLRKGFPLLTTKRMFFKGIVHELLWFLKGNTNSKDLEKYGVNIWHDNSCSEFLKKCNLDYKDGDIGPMYGFQWRHFDAEYQGCEFDYKNDGVDQVKKVLDEMMTDIHSRRMLMTTYNPKQASQGVLYPCHSLIIQFYIEKVEHELHVSLQMYQRSADVFLGLPFNISSMSLFLIIVCDYLCKNTESIYIPKEVIISLGDIHLYESHHNQAIEQLKRCPLKFPRVYIEVLDKDKKITDISDYEYEDIQLDGYYSWKNIYAKMVA